MSKRKLRPFSFVSSIEDNRRQYEALYAEPVTVTPIGVHSPVGTTVVPETTVVPTTTVPTIEDNQLIKKGIQREETTVVSKTTVVPTTTVVDSPFELTPPEVRTTVVAETTVVGSRWVSDRGAFGEFAFKAGVPIRMVQHVLTAYEEDLYNLLWREQGNKNFRIIWEDRNSRKIQVSYAELSRLLNIPFQSGSRTIRNRLQNLCEKFVCEITESANQRGVCAQPTEYEVFSYEQILERQRAAGYTHYVRKGPGKEIVRPENRTLGEGTTVVPKTTVVDRTTVVFPAPEAVVFKTTVFLNEKQEESTYERTNDTPESRDLRSRVLPLHPGFDANLAESLWSRSRVIVPDVSVDEVFSTFCQIFDKLRSNRSVRNINGLILAGWNQVFTPGFVNFLRSIEPTKPPPPYAHAHMSDEEIEQANAEQDRIRLERRNALAKGAGK